MNSVNLRGQRGNMLVLVAAVLAGIIVALVAFGFNYARMLGGQQGQETAIQSAALTAAQDVGRIVVDTPQLGLISFSDQAPIGTNTLATDNYRLQIRSVNTIIGQCRLDYIVGDKLNDPIIKQLALLDFNNLKNIGLPALQKAISDSLQPGGTATDLDNNQIKPYDDAETAFQLNLKKMRSGTNCNYVAGSLKLSPGCLKAGSGVATNIPVPQPTNLAPLQNNQQMSNCYVSDTDMSYNNIPFAFGAIGPTVRLVDQGAFTTDNGLSTQVLAIVKAEADQLIVNSQNQSGLTVHCIACAQPASVYDPRPAPGALSICFPDGAPSNLNSPSDITNQPDMSSLYVQTSSPTPKGITTKYADLLTPVGGDYPSDTTATMLPMAWPLPAAPVITDVWRCGLYDWYRRAGSKMNIQSALDMQTQAFTYPQNWVAAKDWKTYTLESPNAIEDVTTILPGPQIPCGVAHIYKFDSQGNISQKSINCSPVPYTVLSENQMYGEAINAVAATNPIIEFPSTKPTGGKINKKVKYLGIPNFLGTQLTFAQVFDVYVRDECRQYGRQLGGKHAGEPLDDLFTAFRSMRNNTICLNQKKGVFVAIDGGGSGLGAGNGNGNNGNGNGNQGNGQGNGNQGNGQGNGNQGNGQGNGNQGNGQGNGNQGNGQGNGNGNNNGSGNGSTGYATGGPGLGAIPLLSIQSDFCELPPGSNMPAGAPPLNSQYPSGMYQNYPAGSGGVRPTYTTNGAAIEIRFRRQIKINADIPNPINPLVIDPTADCGYLFLEY